MTSARRSPKLPDLPTVAESGFPGFEANGWLGIFVPNGTPPAVIAKLNAEIAKFNATVVEGPPTNLVILDIDQVVRRWRLGRFAQS